MAIDTLQTSSEVVQQEAQEALQEQQNMNQNIISSSEWYAKLTDTQIVPKESQYFFNNTKEILKSWGDTNISDEQIKGYLNNNDLQGLDNLLVDLANKRQERDHSKRIEEVLLSDAPREERVARIAELKQTELKPYTLNDIAGLRAKSYAEALAQQEEREAAWNSLALKELEKDSFQANRIGLSIQNNEKLRAARSNLEAFGEVVEENVAFSRSMAIRTAINSFREAGILSFDDRYLKENVLTGSFLRDFGAMVRSLPDDKFNKAMDIIDKHPFFVNHPFIQAEFIESVLGMGNLSAVERNFADIVNIAYTTRMLKQTGTLLQRQPSLTPRYYPEQPRPKELKAPVIIDGDYTVISETPIAEANSMASTGVSRLAPLQKSITATQAAKSAKYVPDARNIAKITPAEYTQMLKLANVSAPESAKYRVILAPKAGDISPRYLYVVGSDKALQIYKEHPGSLIQHIEITPSAVRKHVENKMTDKGSETRVLEDFTDYQDVTPTSLANIQEAAVRAYANGDSIVGDFNVGARAAASTALGNKIAKFEATKDINFMPTEHELSVAKSEITSGAPKKTTSNSKIIFKPIITQEQLSKLGAVQTVEDLDPAAYAKMQQDIKQALTITQELLRTLPLDIKVSNTNVTPGLESVVLKEVYGVGSNGNQPLNKALKEKLNKELFKDSPFKITTDNKGDIWLSRKTYYSYDTNIATPLDYKDVGTNPLLTHIVSATTYGVPKDVQPLFTQAVGYRAGVKDSFTKLVKKTIKPYNANVRKVGDAIMTQEVAGRIEFSDEKILSLAEGNRDVLRYVKDVHNLDRIAYSVINNIIREENIARGNRSIHVLHNKFNSDIDSIAEDFKEPVIGRLIEKPSLADMQKNFVAYTDNGSVIKPGAEYPFKLEEVNVFKLDPPLMNNSTDKVMYLVAPKTSQGISINALPLRMIGERPGAGWRYKDKYFIRYNPTYRDSAGRISRPVKTVSTASTPQQAKEHIQKLNEIIKALRDYQGGIITKEQADNLISEIAIRGKEVLIPQLHSVGGALQFLEENKMTSLLTDENNKPYFTTTRFSPLAIDEPLEDVPNYEDEVTAWNLVSRYSQREKPLVNLSYDAHLPKLVSMKQYLGDTVNRVSTLMGISPTYRILAKRFGATYGKLIDKNRQPPNDIAFLRDPDTYINPVVKANNEPIYQQAKTFAMLTNQALDQALQDSFKNQVVNYTVDKFVKSQNTGFNTIGDIIYKSPEVSKVATTLMYASTFMLRPSQLVTQTFLTTVQTLALDPINTMKAGALFFPVLHGMNALRRGMNLDVIFKGLEKWPAILERLPGVKGEDLKALCTFLKDVGYGAPILNDIRNNGLMTNINAALLSPFLYGNMASRMIGTIVAAERQRNVLKKPWSKFTHADWAKVAADGDALSGGSSRANKRFITELPVMKQLTMMQSFVANEWELFFGNKLNLSKPQMLLWFGTVLALFGADMFMPDDVSSEQFKQVLMDHGVSKEAAENSAHGAVGRFMSWAAGYPVALGSNAPRLLNNWFVDIIRMLAKEQNEDVDFQPYIAAMLTRFKDTFSKTLLALQNPEEEQDGLSLEQKVERAIKIAARVMPGYTEAERVVYATAFNQWIDSQGNDKLAGYPDSMKQDLEKKAWIQYLTGFKPRFETGITKTAIDKHLKDVKQKTETLKKMATKAWTQAYENEVNEKMSESDKQKSVDWAKHLTDLALQSAPTEAAKDKIKHEIYSTSLRNLGEAERDFFAEQSMADIWGSVGAQEEVQESLRYPLEGEEYVPSGEREKKKEETPKFNFRY